MIGTNFLHRVTSIAVAVVAASVWVGASARASDGAAHQAATVKCPGGYVAIGTDHPCGGPSRLPRGTISKPKPIYKTPPWRNRRYGHDNFACFTNDYSAPMWLRIEYPWGGYRAQIYRVAPNSIGWIQFSPRVRSPQFCWSTSIGQLYIPCRRGTLYNVPLGNCPRHGIRRANYWPDALGY